LKLIPAEQFPKLNALRESNREILLDGLDGIIPKFLQDQIWNMFLKSEVLQRNWQ
jgi:hypothetical protein